MNNHNNINQLTAHLFRENSGKMTAVLSRMFGLSQIDIVLDIVQDTFETALHKWRFSGIPDNPSGWLMQVAKNKAFNTFKRENKTQAYPPSVYLDKFEERFEDEFDILLSPKQIIDSQLGLLFICCHPNLSIKNQIIITLHILCGFGVPEIANALMMDTEAVKKALSRSKILLKESNIKWQSSVSNHADKNIKTAQTILYLMFNEGYKTTRSKKAIDNDLCYEAIRLAKLLGNYDGMLNNETNALLALMFFSISRFPARINADNEWINLLEQDRTQWDKIFIEEGYYYLGKATKNNVVSHFHIEAIISSLHCSASSFEETDWKKIAFLYRQLEKIAPSPTASLNRIIAESYLDTSNSIKAINELVINNDFLVFATKADIYRRKSDLINAIIFYKKAVELSISSMDREFLKKKIIQCSQG